MKKSTQTERGFSLMELLVVIAVLTIIAAIAIPSFIASRRAVKENLDIVKLAGIASAAKTFRQSMGQNRFPYLGELNDTLPGQTSPLCAISESGADIGQSTRSVYNEGHAYIQVDLPSSTDFWVWMIPYRTGQIDYTRPTYTVYSDGRVRTNNRPYPDLPGRTAPVANR